MFVFFFFVRFQWIIILDVFGYIMLWNRFQHFQQSFFKLALYMSWIVIFHKIMNPSMHCKCNKVTYLLCIFKHTLSSDGKRIIHVGV